MPSLQSIARIALYTAAAMFAVSFASRTVPTVRALVKG